jgi:hypothetical protein
MDNTRRSEARNTESGAISQKPATPHPESSSDGQPLVSVTTYRDGGTEIAFVGLQRASQIVVQRDVDLQIDPVLGQTNLRTIGGVVVELGYGLPRVGSTRREILYLLMRTPGVAKTVADIYREMGLVSLADASNLAAAVRCLRRAFRERASSPHFIFSARDPYRLWWDRSRSYRIVEPMSTSPHDADSARFHVQFREQQQSNDHRQA